MVYEAKNFDNLLGTEGFSDELLKNHFTLYNGYVTNTNKVAEILAQMLKNGKMDSYEFGELMRRFGWEFNGMRLHELYFGNMSKDKHELSEDNPLMKKMIETFGSGENCHKNFVAAGSMRGIGWVVMCYDSEGDRLFNIWINEHDVGHLAGAVPLLVMDVFEHAFMIDYGLKKAEYIKAFINAVNWDVVSERFKKASQQ